MSDQFKARSRERFDKLLPVELDTSLTIEQKIPTVIESFQDGFADIVNSKIVSKKILAEMITNADDNFQFRYKFRIVVKVFFFSYLYSLYLISEIIAKQYFTAYMKQKFQF